MLSRMFKFLGSSAAAIAAVTALAVLTAGAARADSPIVRVDFDAAGTVTYVGPNLAPGGPGEVTFTESEFVVRGNGEIKKVRITTHNELVIGELAGITSCEDSAGGAGCATLGALLGGATAESLHTSNATLVVDSSLTTPFTLTGTLRGRLDGAFTVGTVAGDLGGSARLRIRGSGTYGCFDVTGPAPALALLSPCVDGTAGFQMLPLGLDIADTGRFTIDPNPGLGLQSMRGKIDVTALVDATVFPPAVVGAVEISDAKARLALPPAP